MILCYWHISEHWCTEISVFAISMSTFHDALWQLRKNVCFGELQYNFQRKLFNVKWFNLYARWYAYGLSPTITEYSRVSNGTYSCIMCKTQHRNNQQIISAGVRKLNNDYVMWIWQHFKILSAFKASFLVSLCQSLVCKHFLLQTVSMSNEPVKWFNDNLKEKTNTFLHSKVCEWQLLSSCL